MINSDDKSLKGNLIYGLFWNLISALSSQGFPMIAAVITARLLGTFQYGQLGMIYSTVTLFSTFAGLGLGITATKYISQFHKTDSGKTGRIIALTNLFGIGSGIVMCIMLFAIAPWLATNTLSSPNLAPALQIASLLLIFNTIIGIQSGSIAGFGAFKDLARIAIIQGIISSSLTVIGVYFFGLTGAVTAMVINSIINVIMYKITVNNLVKKFKIQIDYYRSWKEKNVLWKLSLPSMLSAVMIGPVVWVANIIIISISGGYEQLGIFNAANQWRTALSFLPMVIGGVLLPMISATTNKENKFLETVNVLAGWVIVILIALPLIAFPEIIAFFYGPDYISSAFLQSLAIMMFVSCIYSYKEGIARKLVVKELVWWGVLSNLTWAVFFVGSVLFLKNLGSLGLSISYLTSQVIVTLIFVPFYISKSVIPKNLIISKEVIFIWAVLIIQTVLTLLSLSLWIRFSILIISILIILFSLNKIWKFNLYMIKKF